MESVSYIPCRWSNYGRLVCRWELPADVSNHSLCLHSLFQPQCAQSVLHSHLSSTSSLQTYYERGHLPKVLLVATCDSGAPRFPGGFDFFLSSPGAAGAPFILVNILNSVNYINIPSGPSLIALINKESQRGHVKFQIRLSTPYI